MLICAATAADADGQQTLDIIASAATAKLQPAGAGRRAAAIGALRFRFQLVYACPVDTRAESIALTVADSHRRLTEDELDGRAVRLTLELPADQTAPVPVIDYCVEDSDAAEPLTLPAMLTASASLRCTGEESQQTIYRAAPLDVVLVCSQPDNESVDDG